MRFAMLLLAVWISVRVGASPVVDRLADKLVESLTYGHAGKVAVLPFTEVSDRDRPYDATYSSIGVFLATGLRTELAARHRFAVVSTVDTENILARHDLKPRMYRYLAAAIFAREVEANIVVVGWISPEHSGAITDYSVGWEILRPGEQPAARWSRYRRGDPRETRFNPRSLTPPVSANGLELAERAGEALRAARYAGVVRMFTGAAREQWTATTLEIYHHTLADKYGPILSIGKPIPQSVVVNELRVRLEGFDDTVDVTATWADTTATGAPVELAIRAVVGPRAGGTGGRRTVDDRGATGGGPLQGMPIPAEFALISENIVQSLLAPLRSTAAYQNLLFTFPDIDERLADRMRRRSLVVARLATRARRSILLPIYCERETLQVELALREDDKAIEFYSVALATEPPWVTAFVKDGLHRAKRTNAADRVPGVTSGGKQWYRAADGQAFLVAYAGDIEAVLRDVNADALLDTVEPLLKEAQNVAVHEIPDKDASSVTPTPQKTTVRAIERTAFDTAVAKLSSVVDRLLSWDSFTVAVELVSTPASATVTMQVGESATSRRGPFITRYTARNIWRGRYRLEMRLSDAYKPAVTEVDLYHDPVKRIACALVPQSESAQSSCQWR